ncbi:MAG: transcriptional regulator, family [Proteobacteria bacterium]|nr:transcriptional regulator, family [Pseudomonadota bacterium]
MTTRGMSRPHGIGGTQTALLRYLRQRGAASRVEIAEVCGVTPAAVSLLTRDLLTRGLVIEGPRRKGGRGAPHIDLELQKSAGYALGINATRYSILLTLLDFGGTAIADHLLRGPFDAFADVLTAIDSGARALVAAQGLGRDALIGAGMAMPTRFRQETLPLDLAEEVKSWAGSDLSNQLGQVLGCPVLIENDANAAAIGELTLGNSADHANFAYLYLSEGIGSGIIINRTLYRGNLGNAGEIGALRGRTLSRPSFEDLANWFAARAANVPPGRDAEAWTSYLADHPDLFEAWLQRAGPELARLAFALTAVLAPSAIYVGGTLPQIVRRRLADWLDFERSNPFDDARVMQPAILLPEVVATDAVACGAAAMILDRAGSLA